MNTYKIATININGISNKTRIMMIGEFLRKQAIDIALLQEVTQPQIENIRGYNTHLNIGSEMRGTAIMMKTGLQATYLRRLPSGRGIAGKINGIHMVNIYAPSGAEYRQERERFFNNELPWLLPTTECDLILAGDFNCIIRKDESTGERNISRALDQLVRGYHLHDAWDQNAENQGYTYYTATGATRLDRIYASRSVIANKKGVETIAAAFTDHMAVALHISNDRPIKTHGRGTWSMNMSIMQDYQYKWKAYNK
jgi:exonuclease III